MRLTAEKYIRTEIDLPLKALLHHTARVSGAYYNGHPFFLSFHLEKKFRSLATNVIKTLYHDSEGTDYKLNGVGHTLAHILSLIPREKKTEQEWHVWIDQICPAE